jgi:hypothetical protein
VTLDVCDSKALYIFFIRFLPSLSDRLRAFRIYALIFFAGTNDVSPKQALIMPIIHHRHTKNQNIQNLQRLLTPSW